MWVGRWVGEVSGWVGGWAQVGMLHQLLGWRVMPPAALRVAQQAAKGTNAWGLVFSNGNSGNASTLLLRVRVNP